jgi:hypothetical protein
MLTPFSRTSFTKRKIVHYHKAGLDWIENSNGFKDILARHYPKLAEKIPAGQSAFKPDGAKKEAEDAWTKAAEENVVDSNIQ